MKKKNLLSLSLNKKSISNLRTQNSVIGGFKTESCIPLGICCPTHDANCPGPSADGTCGNTTTGTGTGLECGPTISCPGAGIC
ncbi:hypothetical protein H2O64_09680 [Kordia sp. YSTF-M3]|uniref:Uncharacterized protein n=1 Tax=Kordia aestuariivivens TaxID=2759037 RepID=A0ABR7Q8Q1_9FLAO|nr:hypothetical protein [Kordia aestuariivivens]MBC8754940.1 hypothetical protein [Kordia aestuariivivens]